MARLIQIETERLRLRPWRDTDREPFAALNADARVMEYFPKLLQRAESDNVINNLQAHISAHGWGFWAAEIIGTREFIGFIGIQVPRAQLPFSPCVEIGWRLAHAYWGKGYAPEGARAALKLGFEALGLDEIVSFTALGNVRSLTVMQKIGMTEDPMTFAHPAIPPEHPISMHRLYRLSADDWKRRRHAE
jgi:RimJ/RimL family protein N-acetyltransferase